MHDFGEPASEGFGGGRKLTIIADNALSFIRFFRNFVLLMPPTSAVKEHSFWRKIVVLCAGGG